MTHYRFRVTVKSSFKSCHLTSGNLKINKKKERNKIPQRSIDKVLSVHVSIHTLVAIVAVRFTHVNNMCI